jgi:PIN domain-containing protein
LKTNYVLIDYENVQVTSLALLSGEHFRVKLFLGPNNKRLPVDLVLAMQELGDRAQYVVLETAGTNALDFHIAYYLGALAAADPSAFFHVISKDTGFDPLIRHLKSNKILSSRSVSIEAMPCFASAASNANGSDAAKEQDQAGSAAGSSVEESIRLAVADLIKRKSAKPRTAKTLLSTIHAKCGKEVPAAEIEAVFTALVERGYVQVSGTKLSYTLPAA